MKPWRVHQVTLSWLPPQEMPGTENPNHGTESQILAQTHGLLTDPEVPPVSVEFQCIF